MSAIRRAAGRTLRRSVSAGAALALMPAAVLAGSGPAGAAQPVAGAARAAAVAGLVHTTSQAGYVTGGGRYFRFVAATVTVAPAAVPAGNASSAEVVLGSTTGPPATLQVAAGGGTGSVTYTWSSGTQGHAGTLAGLAPAPGDDLTLSVYYDQLGHDVFTAADATQGSSQTARVDVGTVIYTAAEAAAVADNATVTPPAADARLWAFSNCHVTTYTGVRGTLAGPWTTSQVIDTTTGTAGGFVVASAPVLWNSGQDFGAWLRARVLKLTGGVLVQAQGGIAVDPRTGTIYAAGEVVSVISGQTNKVTATIPVTGALAVNPQTDTIYAANGRSVAVISGQTNTVTATIPVGGQLASVAVNPATNTIYAAGSGDSVAVISGQTNTVTATIPMGGQLASVAVNPATNTIYAAGSGDSVAVISGRTNTVTATISLSGQPHFIAVNSQTNAIYVTSSDNSTIQVISGQTNTVTGTIGLDFGPAGEAVDPATNTIYVTDWSASTVSAISGSTNTVIATAGVGAAVGPLGVAVNPQTNTIYVAGDIYSTLSVLTW